MMSSKDRQEATEACKKLAPQCEAAMKSRSLYAATDQNEAGSSIPATSQDLETKTATLVSPAAAIADRMPNSFYSTPRESAPTDDRRRPHYDVTTGHMGCGGMALVAR